MSENTFAAFAVKMQAAGLAPSAILAFRHNYQNLVAGRTGTLPESSIQPVTTLPRLEESGQPSAAARERLSKTVLLKLNGGLGTSMGLERAKSLLEAKPGLTFLDFMVRHVLWVQRRYRVPLDFILMNSFSTGRDTLAFLQTYPELGAPRSLELLQGRAPKVDAGTLRPASWPANPQLEWCPPGHGDLYPSLFSSGRLNQWLEEGRRYLFVSNADNLGASLDLGLLEHFADSGRPFLMEVAQRTPSDRKGGHLAQRDGKLLLREAAQCPEEDFAAFHDIQRHRFFNTNNLWLRLDSLNALLSKYGGYLPLPLLTNRKTVDPRDPNSPAVFQLETAMGAALECFDGAGAIVVPRTRFAPVKTTADLMALRSDAYSVTEDWRLVLAQDGLGTPPSLNLDGPNYKLVEQLEPALAAGVPSLKRCRELIVHGPVWFSAANEFVGKVTLTNPSSSPRLLAPGVYSDASIVL